MQVLVYCTDDVLVARAPAEDAADFFSDFITRQHLRAPRCWLPTSEILVYKTALQSVVPVETGLQAIQLVVNRERLYSSHACSLKLRCKHQTRL